MSATRSAVLRLLALSMIVAVHLLAPNRARADGTQPCNIFCWPACNEVQGAWCVGSCGSAGLVCMWGSPCSQVGHYKIACWEHPAT